MSPLEILKIERSELPFMKNLVDGNLFTLAKHVLNFYDSAWKGSKI